MSTPGKLWCAMCGKWGDHTSGTCPELAWLRKKGPRLEAWKKERERCPNDTDGDGDCHRCHGKPGGCDAVRRVLTHRDGVLISVGNQNQP